MAKQLKDKEIWHVVTGSGDDDVLHGTGHDDELYGGQGDDELLAYDGDDRAFGQSGDDTIYAEDGRDLLRGGMGDDVLYAGEGDDRLHGGGGANSLYGGGGDDRLQGGTGANRMKGGTGDDVYVVWNEADTVIEYDFEGEDRVVVRAADWTMTSTDIEKVLLGAGAIDFRDGEEDTRIDGNEADNGIAGDRGDDTLIGGAGHDLLNGGMGANRLTGGEGDDTMAASMEYSGQPDSGTAYADDAQRFDGGAGDDSIQGGDAADRLQGGDGDDWLHGLGGTNAIFGGAGNDFILSDGDPDPFDFGTEGGGTHAPKSVSERIDGGEGIDTLKILALIAHWDPLNLDLRDGEGKFMHADGDVTRYFDVEQFYLSLGHGSDAVVLGDHNDTVRGNAGDDSLSGGAGNDLLEGGFGDDFLVSGLGDDSLYGGAGNDRLTVSYDGDGRARLHGGSGNDSLSVNVRDGAFTLIGGAGDDRLSNALGAGQMVGGAGSDHFILGNVGPTPELPGGKIKDFEQGEDSLKLSFDTDSGDIIFIGATAFSGASGELRYEQIGSKTFVTGDLDGDAEADFTVTFIGAIDFVASDFGM